MTRKYFNVEKQKNDVGDPVESAMWMRNKSCWKQVSADDMKLRVERCNVTEGVTE